MSDELKPPDTNGVSIKKRKPRKLPDDVVIINSLEEINPPDIIGVSIKKRKTRKLPDDFIIIENSLEEISPVKIILTEDLGKKFEMGICMLYGIEYDGKYKYSMEEAEKLKERLTNFPKVFPHKLKHTAKNGSQYDFTGEEDETIKLSAKTTKKDGKVCPQVIGQPSKKKFCEFFNVDSNFTLEQIKEYIEVNVDKMLNIYFDLTFDCPILYYNQKRDVLQLVKLTTHQNGDHQKINWSELIIEFSHKKKNKAWAESSTISINNVTIGEFQVHNNRDCIKFRWAFENLLKIFPNIFEVINL